MDMALHCSTEEPAKLFMIQRTDASPNCAATGKHYLFGSLQPVGPRVQMLHHVILSNSLDVVYANLERREQNQVFNDFPH